MPSAHSSGHKPALIQRWLVAHPRVLLPFTPTSPSWLTLLACCFSPIQRRELVHASFHGR